MKKAVTLWSRYKVFKEHAYTLYLVIRHPQTPAHVKLLTGLIVLYILSPFDLLPDLYPVIGYVDELVLTPLFVDAVLRLVPRSILESCQKKTDKETYAHKRKLWYILCTALLLIVLLVYYAIH